MVDVVMEEIEDRRAWLDDMEALGQAGTYRNRILTEIAQRVKRLEELQKMKDGQ